MADGCACPPCRWMGCDRAGCCIVTVEPLDPDDPPGWDRVHLCEEHAEEFCRLVNQPARPDGSSAV